MILTENMVDYFNINIYNESVVLNEGKIESIVEKIKAFLERTIKVIKTKIKILVEKISKIKKRKNIQSTKSNDGSKKITFYLSNITLHHYNDGNLINPLLESTTNKFNLLFNKIISGNIPQEFKTNELISLSAKYINTKDHNAYYDITDSIKRIICNIFAQELSIYNNKFVLSNKKNIQNDDTLDFVDVTIKNGIYSDNRYKNLIIDMYRNINNLSKFESILNSLRVPDYTNYDIKFNNDIDMLIGDSIMLELYGIYMILFREYDSIVYTITKFVKNVESSRYTMDEIKEIIGA